MIFLKTLVFRVYLHISSFSGLGISRILATFGFELALALGGKKLRGYT